MEGAGWDDLDILRALGGSGARLLLIGRRAVVALGIPVLTADYDVWIHIDDIEVLNRAMAALDYVPNHDPAAARARGRYVLEDGEHIDVLVARAKTAADGTGLDFDGAWTRRQTLDVTEGVSIALPSLADLITTKKWASRPRDLLDIEQLEALRKARSE